MATDELIQPLQETTDEWALHAAAQLREQGRLGAIAGAQPEAALAWAALRYGDRTLPVGTLASTAAVDVAQVLVTIGADPATRLAALLAWLPLQDGKTREGLRQRAGPEVAALVEGTARLDSIQTLSEVGEAGTTPAQQESLRKMLLAMVQDIRTVLIKLAQELVTLRTLTRHPDEALRRRHARVTLDLFAPLANRLGIWQLKWEMEDLAFRLSDPDTYKRIAKLLAELQGVPVEQRTARFTCVLCLAQPDGSERFTTGTCEGTIGFAPAGTHGFGYDPIFVLPGGKTMSELTRDEKSALSHRGHAFRAMLPVLESLFPSPP
jgi:(p)ppGpp synthase/HD superfamily hydrolase